MSDYLIKTSECPSQDSWMAEARQTADAGRIGMYLTHTGVVRSTPKAMVRGGDPEAGSVAGMMFSYDEKKAEAAISEALALPGIYYLRVWLASGRLDPGDTIMQVLIGGDIRPHVIDGLQFLVGKFKSECVSEREIF